MFAHVCGQAVDEAEKQKRREEGKTPKRGKKAAGSIGPGFLEEGATSLGYKRDFVRVTELSDEEDEDDADEGVVSLNHAV